MALSRYEKETIINYNEDGDTANIFTASESMKKKLAKFGELKETTGGWEINVPKSWVVIKPPRKASEAQRIAARESLAKARAKKADICSK